MSGGGGAVPQWSTNFWGAGHSHNLDYGDDIGEVYLYMLKLIKLYFKYVQFIVH